MKIKITLPDSAMADVKEYCRETNTDLQAEIQQRIDIFVRNALEQMEQRRQAKGDPCQP